MLEELNVKNFALIDDISVSFNEGLNVLTGETGAGKSILVGALGILLGKKGDKSFVRTGCEEAVVSGILNVSGHRDVPAWLEKHDIEDEDGALIIRRTIKKSGRGSIYVQSHPVLRTDLEELTSLLVDMHSQHEHQSLFVVDNHRILLDRFGGLEKDSELFHRHFISYGNAKRELQDLINSREEQILEMEELRLEVAEIEEAILVIGEEEEIEKDISILARQEEIFSSLDSFRVLVSENRGGALSQLRKGAELLDSMSEIDESLKPLQKRFENTFFELEDIGETLRTYQREMESDPSELAIKEDRLALISRLEKKYGHTIDIVLSVCKEKQSRISFLEEGEFHSDELKKNIGAAGEELKRSAAVLSSRRKASATLMEQKIRETLHELGMNAALFKVDLNRKRSDRGAALYGPWGIDSIEFLLSANSGEEARPLKAVASGGEISRVMLALKTVLADSDDVSSLVFDEIDTGIGGEVALAVGAHMRDLARYKQVLSITHLASIAVFADNHIIVKKSVIGERTVTSVRNIDEDERTREIARMLSGDSDGSASISHAQQMLSRYGTV